MYPIQPQDATLQTRFSMEQARVFSLEHRLKNHENREELMKTAQQFEGLFIKQLLQEMDKTIDRSESLLGGGSAEETFRAMFYDQISRVASERPHGLSGLGLAESIYRQLEQHVPVLPPSEATP